MENNEEKKKKQIYKKWWFWLLIVIIIVAITSSEGDNNVNTSNSSSSNYQKDNRIEVAVVDFSIMTRDEVEVWFTTNKINGKISEKYSDNVAKGEFIDQSIKANTIIHEGDKITINYSLGKEPTTEQKNALRKAESYSRTLHMSKKGIYNQLTSEYGEKFSAEAAQYAIDNMEADWNANALAKAKSYQTTMNMSKQRIYDQLISEYGEKFTEEEAQYAIDHLDD